MSTTGHRFDPKVEATITATLVNGDRFTFTLDLGDDTVEAREYVEAARRLAADGVELYGTLAPVNPGTYGAAGLPPIPVCTVLREQDVVGVYVHMSVTP